MEHLEEKKEEHPDIKDSFPCIAYFEFVLHYYKSHHFYFEFVLHYYKSHHLYNFVTAHFSLNNITKPFLFYLTHYKHYNDYIILYPVNVLWFI